MSNKKLNEKFYVICIEAVDFLSTNSDSSIKDYRDYVQRLLYSNIDKSLVKGKESRLVDCIWEALNSLQITEVEYSENSMSDGSTLFKKLPANGFVRAKKKIDKYFCRMSVNYKLKFEHILNSL